MGCSDAPRYKKSVILSTAKDRVALLDTDGKLEISFYCKYRVGG
jgi:hypothetical protein